MRPIAQLRFISPPFAWRPDLALGFRSARGWLAATSSLLAVAAIALGGWGLPEARAQSSKEYDLKAVLLFHFTQFVEWPPGSFQTADTPLVIGILGHDPFGKVLDEVVKQETRDHRRIVVERYRSVNAIGNCQVLFIDGSELRNFPRIVSALHGRPILTVGDFDDFAQRGGMIRFIKNPEDKISLLVNLDAAKACGLNISAKLLRVAEVMSNTNN